MSKTSGPVMVLLSTLLASAGYAQPAPPIAPPLPAPEPVPAPPDSTTPPVPVPTMPPTTAPPYAYPPPPLPYPPPPPAAPSGPKPPKKGDFDAGGQLHLPNGPDETGKYATYNWIGLDVKGKYNLLDAISVNGTIPLAIKHPGTLEDGSNPKWFGGFNAQFQAKVPRLPLDGPELGLAVSVAYMHEGALLLSDKDFPKFVGNYEPGITVGPIIKLRLSSLFDFTTLPLFTYQGADGTANDKALQFPTSLIVKLGDLVKLQADFGIYTGPGYSLKGSDGGRIALGVSLDVKIWKIISHLGAGFASLETGPLYPTIRDSVYLDLNVKFAK